MTKDGGDTWEEIKNFSLETPSQQWISGLCHDPGSGRIIMGSYTDAQIWVGIPTPAWIRWHSNMLWKPNPIHSNPSPWVTDHWQSALNTGFQVVDLVPADGTGWNGADFRPTSFRMEANNGSIPGSLWCYFYFGGSAHVLQITQDLQEVTIDPSWYDAGDFDRLAWIHFVAAPTWDCTNIEFFFD
jgi:hypothetical protein